MKSTKAIHRRRLVTRLRGTMFTLVALAVTTTAAADAAGWLEWGPKFR